MDCRLREGKEEVLVAEDRYQCLLKGYLMWDRSV